VIKFLSVYIQKAGALRCRKSAQCRSLTVTLPWAERDRTQSVNRTLKLPQCAYTTLSCSLVEYYQPFRRTWCYHHQIGLTRERKEVTLDKVTEVTDNLTFNIRGSVYRNSRLKKSNEMQQYTAIYLLLNYCICFGLPSHPSPGIHKTLVAAFGTDHTICTVPNQSLFGHVWESLLPR